MESFVKTNPTFYIIYDGINNSVFEGQVLAPFLFEVKNKPTKQFYLISFEKEKINLSKFEKILKENQNLEIVILKRFSFLGKISLYHSIFLLKKLLKNYNNYYIITRGPLAGWITKKSINQKLCLSFKIQARGLLYEEYIYSHPTTKNFLKNLFNYFRSNQLYKIEKEIYKKDILIETVSNALKEYLINKYHALDNNISISKNDIPNEIDKNICINWKYDIRKQLNVNENTHVYCYNGSIKAWQCPEMVIDFFKNKLNENKNIFLLILTQDVEQFESLIKDKIPQNYFKVLTVKYNEIYKYLSCADTGLIFRQQHIVNWVSRPTKALEYKSVGLKIIHNNTVSWLIENEAI